MGNNAERPCSDADRKKSSGARASIALIALLLIAASCAVTAPPMMDPTQPGADGPCAVSKKRSVNNPAQWELETFVYEPTGTATPYSGGTCDDDDRPVIFFGHGYTASFTLGYEAFLHHLVSNGFVVVYPGYQLEFDPIKQYRAEDAGFVAGIAATPRADTERIGFVGHSWGAGMIPAMMQRAEARGWGAKATWGVMMAPSFPYEVGTAEIELDSDTHLTVISFDEDSFVDMRIANDVAAAVTLDESRLNHLLVRTDRRATPQLVADHFSPITLGIDINTGLNTDHHDRWAVWRPIAITANCALSATWCDADMEDMGILPNGHVVRRGELVAPGSGRDIGPPALVECGGVLSPLYDRDCS